MARGNFLGIDMSASKSTSDGSAVHIPSVLRVFCEGGFGNWRVVIHIGWRFSGWRGRSDIA